MVGSTIGIFALLALWVALTTDRQPIWLNAALVTTWLIALAMTIPIALYARRRPADADPTWGEAMIAATYVFFLLFWLYGVVPHQFLTFTDSELAWRSDKFLVGPELPSWLPVGGGQQLLEFILPFKVNYLVLRDILVVIIYNIFFGGQIWLWVIWQLRGKEMPATGVEKSRYGRPVVKAKDLSAEGVNA